MNPLTRKHQAGFGLLETLVATAIFLIVAGGGAVLVLGAFSTNRLGTEQTQAIGYAQEGLEAARSVHKQGWAGMTPGTYGIDPSGGSWAFSGSSNTSGKFSRQIIIEQAQRDGSGNIVNSGGTPDPDTVRVTSSVQWGFTPTRNNTVNLTSYLTHWQKPIGGNGGLLVYANRAVGDDAVSYRILNPDGTWGPEQQVPPVSVQENEDVRYLRLYDAPNSNEKILLRKHAENGAGQDTYLFAQVWDGTSWINTEFFTAWNGFNTPDARNLDGAYLADGRFLVVFDNNGNTPGYAIWNGTSWSSGNTPNVGGNPNWIDVKAEPGTNRAMITVLDATADTNTFIYNGSTFLSSVQHAVNTTSTAVDGAVFTWSTFTPGHGFLVYNANNDTTPNTRYTNGAGWTVTAQNINIGSATRAMQTVSYPTATAALTCVKDQSSSITCLRTNATPNFQALTSGTLTTTTDPGTQRSFDIAFEQQGLSTGLAVYSGGTSLQSPKYRTFSPTSGAFSSEQSLPNITGPLNSVTTVSLRPQANSDDMMVLYGTSDQRLWTAGWDGTNDTFYSTGELAPTERAQNGSFSTDYWYDFAWD